MSTEHQRYSLENQIAAISEYAETRGYAIVQTYADPGKSGLTLKGRAGLKQLLADVLTGRTTYSAILVLDVSRWGRFQDADQSAHYEFLCRNGGVAVHYCGEPFENDGSMVSTIVKNLKRVMASEYSRELSTKTSRAQKQQAQLGFRQGGGMPYGVRRMLVSKDGQFRFVLGPHEGKGLSTDRVTFVPGPPEELKTVQRIFRMFVEQKRSIAGIANILNDELVPSTDGSAWSYGRVHTVLSNELMIGFYVFNKTSRKLKAPCRPNPPSQWIRTQVMDPIVDPKWFAKAQRALASKRYYAYTKDDMLKRLKRLYRVSKKLTSTIIDNCPYTPCAQSYHEHFGSLRAAYAAIGYEPPYAVPKRGRAYSDEELLDGIRQLHTTFGYVTTALINADRELPVYQVYLDRFGSIINAYALAGFPTTELGTIAAAHRRRLQRRDQKYPDAVLLDGIRRLHAAYGYVTISLIDADPALPQRSTFEQRFGSIMRAYELAGCAISQGDAVRQGLKRASQRRLEGLRYDPSKYRSD